MADEKKLKKAYTKRRNAVEALHRQKGFAETVTTTNANEASNRLDLLEKAYEKFESSQDEIDELEENDDMINENFELRAVLEKLYASAKTILQDAVSSMSLSVVKAETNTSAQRIKLPTISLPSYSGNPSEWLSFHDTYVSLIHDSDGITPVQKFHYLRAALKGEAALVIQTLAITADNYDLAWKTVVNRYSNKVLLRKRHVRSLFAIRKASSAGSAEIRRVSDEFALNIKVLEQLGEPISDSSSILIEMLIRKLDDDSISAWEESLEPEKQPTYPELLAFLHKRIHQLESIAIDHLPANADHPRKSAKPRVNANVATINQQSKCPVCSEDHLVYQCTRFNSYDCKKRSEIVSLHKLCTLCLKAGHVSRQCSLKLKCRICSKRHNTLVHSTQLQDVVSPVASRSTASGRESSSNAASVTNSRMTIANISSNISPSRQANSLLSIVLVFVVDINGKEHPVRALLDNGAEPNAMSERLCQQLGLPRQRTNVIITGVDELPTKACSEVTATIRSRDSMFSASLRFLVLRKVTGNTPARSFDINNWAIPGYISLADPGFNCANSIDMILGASHFYEYLKEGRIRLNNGPMLVETVFGWVVTGEFQQDQVSTDEFSVRCNLAAVSSTVEDQLRKFWEIEEVNYSQSSLDDNAVESHYQETTTRDANGKYIVRLPKHSNLEKMIGNSKSAATRRLLLLEKRFAKDESMKQQYHAFIQEYITLNHMSPVTSSAIQDQSVSCYLPHHAVVKESSTTTKVRVVFDGAAKTSTGFSLNDALLVGPVVQDDLLKLILRFRKFKVAIIADIEKMYRQVLMHPSDRSLQRILWRFDEAQPIQEYDLNTVTYGLTPSSFLATRTMLQLVEDEGYKYPLASNAIRNHLYVDDLIAGANNIEQAIRLRDELNELTSKAGFRFRKWASNELAVLADVSPDLLATKSSHRFDEKESINTLGIAWELEPDVFRFNVGTVESPDKWTKRSILSHIARLYDPLGLVSPVVIQAKLIMQDLWLSSVGWDEEIPEHVRSKWIQFCDQLPNITQFSIPRFAFHCDYAQVELHYFADASEKAYGTCVYARSEHANGSVKICLLASKSRVAPLKPLTIPKLELCAALLATRLHERVTGALDIQANSVHFWSDSTIVLQWIGAPARNWKVFVSNRVAEIQELTHGYEWRHVAGKQNPADLISRGMPADQFVLSKLWRNGPEWLSNPKSFWPETHLPREVTNVESKLQNTAVLSSQVSSPNRIFEAASSFKRLIRIVSYILRFYNNAKVKAEMRNTSRNLSVDELQCAKRTLAKLVQSETFKEELKCLRKNQTLPKASSLRLLAPFLDHEGLLRVGGRLKRSSIPYDVKHPIVLPGFHPFTQLMLKHHHLQLIHGGISVTVSSARDEFWPLQGKRAVRSVIRNCFRCIRASPKPIKQPEGQLPAVRVTAVGTFGPLFLRPTHRKAAPRKCYICVFVCMTTKAVHLELVSDLSTSSFLMALDRFVSRRNKPAHIYSDNGTNFIGANNSLHRIYEMLRQDENKICSHLADQRVQWHFIPPRSPNFGGLWEASVKVAKKQLVRQLGSAMLSEEEMMTVLTKIEACLNSRPLMALSGDPNDLSALTPAHFLFQETLIPLPELDVSSVPLNRLIRYQLLSRHSQDFWKRWRNEYLKTLNNQHYPAAKIHKLQVGDMVILKEEHLPAACWPLARIHELHPGADGIVRVVTVRTAAGLLKRAVNKICLLECAREI